MQTKQILVFAIAAVSAAASATVLTFEDNSFGGYQSVGAYGGLTFDTGHSTLAFSDWASDYSNTTVFPSGSMSFFNGSGVPSTSITSGTDFDFNGGSFIGWGEADAAQSYTTLSLTIEGWDDGNLVGSVTRALTANSFSTFTTNFLSVDEVRFLNASSTWWVGDDLEVNAVPEPATMVVIGLGLAAVSRRRRSN